MIDYSNIELEQALIACLIRKPDAETHGLTSEALTDNNCRIAFNILKETGDPLAIGTQYPEMRPWIGEVIQCFHMPSNLPSYCQQIKELYARRRFLEMAQQQHPLAEIRETIANITAETIPPLSAKKFTLPESLPKREWLYGTHLIRRFTSMTVAAAGTGKSTIAITDALAICTGKPLLGHHVHKPCNVWIVNLEDPLEEMQRRTWAACLKHGIDLSEINGKLFLNSGRDRGLTIAAKGNLVYTYPDKDALIAAIKRDNIGLLIVDPFVSSYDGNENDNKDVDKAIKAFNQVADETNCSIELIHHTGKTGGEAGNANAGRGASAMVGAVRSLRTIVTMTEDEAVKYDIKNPRAYIRIDDGKPSLAAYSPETDWYAIESLELPNGDNVGVVDRWVAPALFDGISVEKIRHCIEVINEGRGEGRLYHESKAGNSKDAWVGFVISKELSLNETKSASIVKTWLKNGILYEKEYYFDSKPVKGLVGNSSKF